LIIDNVLKQKNSNF